MFRKYKKWADTAGIAFPDNVDGLLQRYAEIEDILHYDTEIHDLVMQGMY